MDLVASPRRTLSRSLPAVPASVVQARHDVIEFARRSGAAGERLEDVRLAVSEAVTNVVLHAYDGEEPGSVALTAAVAGEELWVLVADDGHGLQASSRRPGLGMGLALIASVCDLFSVVKRGSGGTELRMRFALGSA